MYLGMFNVIPISPSYLASKLATYLQPFMKYYHVPSPKPLVLNVYICIFKSHNKFVHLQSSYKLNMLLDREWKTIV